MIDLQYPRLAIMQEIDNKAGQKANGTLIKSINSGGDTQTARKNFQDEMKFVVGCKLLVAGNDMVQVDPVDTFETCIQFNSGKQFKSQGFIDATRAELEAKAKDEPNEEKKLSILSKMNTYLVADDKIKDKCKTLRWGNAMVLLLMKKFIVYKLEPTNDSDMVDDEFKTDDVIESRVMFTTNEKDILTNTDLKRINMELGLGLSLPKFKNILIARGAKEKRLNRERGLNYVKEILDTSDTL